MLSSEALIYEGKQGSIPTREEHTLAVLVNAKEIIKVTEKETERAINLTAFGIKSLDALHLALAETGKADYFCTCDDRLLHNSKKVTDLTVKVINPVDLVQEIEKWLQT